MHAFDSVLSSRSESQTIIKPYLSSNIEFPTLRLCRETDKILRINDNVWSRSKSIFWSGSISNCSFRSKEASRRSAASHSRWCAALADLPRFSRMLVAQPRAIKLKRRPPDSEQREVFNSIISVVIWKCQRDILLAAEWRVQEHPKMRLSDSWLTKTQGWADETFSQNRSKGLATQGYLRHAQFFVED